MCGPILPIIAVAATAVSTIQGASAARAAGQAQSNQVIYEAQNNQAVAEYNAQATENIAKYNAQVAENNALIYDRAAKDSIQRGADAAAEERAFSRASNARGRAVMGSSGTIADTGTNLELLVQNSANGEMNSLAAMNAAEREAYGYQINANSERARARGETYVAGLDAEQTRLGGKVGLLNATYAGANARYSGDLNAQSTLISGAASLGRQAYAFKDDIFSRNATRSNPYR